MAEKAKEETQVSPLMETIEDLARHLGTPAWVLVGVKAANDWGEGKAVTEQEFLACVDRWLKSPMSGGDR